MRLSQFTLSPFLPLTEATRMRFYPHQHAYYCGVDLHARSMFVHVLDQHGQHLFAKDLPACPDAFRCKRDSARRSIPSS
jgi:hypothetical protein